MKLNKKLAAAFMCATLAAQIIAPIPVNAVEKIQQSTIMGREAVTLRLKGENTPTFKYGEKKNLKLTLKNASEEEIKNITVSPKLTTTIEDWPFEIEKVSYEKEVEKLAGKGAVDIVFSVTPRQNVESKYYKVVFDVSYGDKTLEQRVFVKMEGKPTPKPESKPEPAPEPETKPNLNGVGMDIPPAGGVINDIPADSGETNGTSSKSTLTPRVIVTGFSTEPGEVKAGSNFKLIVHLENTSKNTTVKNMLFDFNAPSEGSDENTTSPAFLPSSGSSVVYLESIKAGGKKDISIDLNAKADLAQKPYSIDLSMKYEDGNGGQFESAASISVPVKQDARFEFSEFEMSSDTVEVGSEANVMCNLYNLGRVKLYNVKAKFEGEDIKSKELFVGNVEPGATAIIDGMVTGQQVTTGDGKVKLLLSYEDEAGTVFNAEKELSIFVTEAVSQDAMLDEPIMNDEQEKKGFPVIPVVIVVLVIAGITAFIFVKKQKKKKANEEEEEFLEDELDRLTEDE